MGDDDRRGVYTSLHAHFEAVPMIDDYLKVNNLEDLAPAIELYNALIGLRQYDNAISIFIGRLSRALHFRLSANQQRIELLELLFPDGVEQPPRLSNPLVKAYVFNELALAYKLTGRLKLAAPLYRRASAMASEMGRDDNRSIVLYNLSVTLRMLGELYESESAARHALVITRTRHDYIQEAISLRWLGLTLATRGVTNRSEYAFQRSLRISIREADRQLVGTDNADLAQQVLWLKEFSTALSFAGRAWELAHVLKLERDFIRAARLQGEAALGLNDFVVADERLHHALTRARTVNFVEEELPALVALAELRRQQGELGAARELLGDVWEAAERGPYPLFHADACCVLAEVERDEGNVEKAVEAAGKAYRLAWCDGPPFAYHWGLERARALLKELGVGEPEMPAFDALRFEPMPEVEIDSADEFGAGGGESSEAGG